MACEFRPHRLTETIRGLTAAAERGKAAERVADNEETGRRIAECDRKLGQYRAALDAGANPAVVAVWIAETEAEKASCALVMRRPATTRRRMTEAEIKAVVDRLADIARVLSGADPDDKAEVFRQMGLKLTYQPGRQVVAGETRIPDYWQIDGVRGLQHGAASLIRSWGSPGLLKFLTVLLSRRANTHMANKIHQCVVTGT